MRARLIGALGSIKVERRYNMKIALILSIMIISANCQNSLTQDRSIEQKQNRQAVPEPESVIKGLRNKFLTTKPQELGFSQKDSKPLAWGIFMEIGYPEALATLISFRDGQASLYLGTGGGVIGGIGHEKVRRAAIAFVEESEKYLNSMTKTESFPYPAVGQVKFYVRTFNGVFTAEADEAELGEGKHKLSPLFYSGQEVLTQLRLVSETLEKE
jgi:hypothetical protein